jgi:hypothetical protein
MGLDKKLSQLMDCPLSTNNTHIIMSTKIAHTQKQMGNHTRYIGQTIYNGQKRTNNNPQKKTTQKTKKKKKLTITNLIKNPWLNSRCSGRVGSSCTTSRATLV